MSGQDLLVRRDDLGTIRVDAAPGEEVELADGEVLLRVDAFALTANNVTYGVLGDAFGYWEFFPAPEGWGRVPVWGFAEVLRSTVAGIEEGERVYGYLPMSTHLVVRPERVSDDGFSDGAAHRAARHPVYNRYQRCAVDPGYDPEREAEQMLLRPLFTTAFLIDDQLADAEFHGADRVLLSSASSKTAYATAFLLSERGAVQVAGLTSERNRAFVEGLGVYGSVVAYDEVDGLDLETTAYVDMSGDGAVRAAVHRRLGDALRLDLAVGATHHDQMAAGGGELPGPVPTLFFAPDRVKQRTTDWGQAGFEDRVAGAWARFLAWLGEDALRVERAEGPEAAEAVFTALVAGDGDAAAGHILSL